LAPDEEFSNSSGPPLYENRKLLTATVPEWLVSQQEKT